LPFKKWFECPENKNWLCMESIKKPEFVDQKAIGYLKSLDS
jgi:hypothetical protein